MTNHLVRLYTAAGTIVAFFLLWATIAAHPWATTQPVTAQDPRLIALAQREKRLQKRAAGVKRTVDHRWAMYERRAARRQWQNSVALQRHLQQLEASQAAAVRSAQVAVAQTAQARAYAASVVAWANQQLQVAGATAEVSSTAAPSSAPASTSTVQPMASNELRVVGRAVAGVAVRALTSSSTPSSSSPAGASRPVPAAPQLQELQRVARRALRQEPASGPPPAEARARAPTRSQPAPRWHPMRAAPSAS